ncbi:BTB/POZ domain-containing family protein [Tripterygium wilfordii]|uniref:BTB/POZ domain-containing family protein n=1 Tax=Tripterygium wilfordii TaxID=458696 RepID=A0A7J7BT88_TRIWF|nr:BTB/POZ domain-containing protein At4g08455-like [Tripterygium wilfordii]KAF5725299.1 BTB/POZ domain-containing family protein [Tripterygium wilfordii]
MLPHSVQSGRTAERDGGERRMKCVSCRDEYGAHDAGTCKECYEEASETEEELKREIEDLKAKVSFLRFDNHQQRPSFTDVVLVAYDGQPVPVPVPVPAHKAVLMSRSPVFKAMLETEMEESRSGTIKISDVSYDALRAFVNYLYTAEACLDEQMAYDLLVLAEKYQVKHLKAYCEKFLVSKLNWDNSIMSYAFAHQHNAKHVLDAALSMITENMNKVTKREEYVELLQKEPRLIVDIYEAYVAKLENTAAHKDS